MTGFIRAAGVCLAVSTWLALSGCAGSLRQNYLRDKAATHVYRQPLAELWPQVKALLKERGYSWKEAPGSYVLETEWRDSGGGTLGASAASRYLVEGVSRAQGGVVLRVMRGDRVTQPTGVGYVQGSVGDASTLKGREERSVAVNNASTSGVLPTRQNYARDLELELLLLQRIDPGSAARLEAEARSAHP
ncbi:hypothetical protein LZ198_19940 [Myxococcus sp. K15C18031901]|uniref:hypothetical protein n=1 Tax=Myxococcus dinghuensis TaxID=2906761 RepID=UPI0020A82F8C|nr:hypothetical protein [Myxococcus dinghuensis]MCP3101151.1 hypothetical protein [Myxococcus dinghuensis]